MPRAKLVPWRHHDDLLDVRSAFYPSPGGQDRRRDAVTTVRAWSVRGKVPHLIDSTSLLTEAVLNDVPDASPRVACLAYSAAFCRFVTGLTDVALKGAFHLTMYKVAKNLGLPTALVELRHAATHGQLLSLPVLRKTTQRSLQWLWSNYWVKIDDSKSHETGTGADDHFDIEEFKYQLRGVLRPYKKSCGMRSRQHLMPDEDEIRVTCRTIQDSCRGEVDKAFFLIDVLLEPGFILPSMRSIGNEHMVNDKIPFWNGLLKALSNPAMPSFLPSLLDELLNRICEKPTKPIRNDVHKGSIFHWISHILSSQEWRDEQAVAGINLESILQKCFMNPNDWTMKVTSLLLSINDTLKTNYDELARLAQIQLKAGPQLPVFLMESQLGAGQMERAESKLITDIWKEIEDNEAKYIQLKKLLGREAYESSTEESLDLVSVVSGASLDDENEEGEEDEESEEPKRGSAHSSTGGAARGWKMYEGDWVPKPIGVV